MRRRLPSSLTVEVTEREAAAAVTVGSDLYLCTHEGELFKRLEAGDPSALSVITGLTADQLAQDRPAAIRRVRDALDLAADYERRGPSKRLPVRRSISEDDGTVRMLVGREGVLLSLGSHLIAKRFCGPRGCLTRSSGVGPPRKSCFWTTKPTRIGWSSGCDEFDAKTWPLGDEHGSVAPCCGR